MGPTNKIEVAVEIPERVLHFGFADPTRIHHNSLASLMFQNHNTKSFQPAATTTAMNRAPSKPSATCRRSQPKAPANPKPKNRNPRSPLKDLNGGVFKSSNSSTSSSTSIEPRRGCLRSLISNSSSSSSFNSSKTPLRLPKSNSTNPKSSATNKSRLKSCKPVNQRPNIVDGGTSSAATEDKFPKVTRLRRWQSGKKFSSGSAQNPKKESVSAEGRASSVKQSGSRSGRLGQQVTVGEGRQSGKDFQFTPVGCKLGGSVSKLACGFDNALGSNCDMSGIGSGNTPPVEATVSPEIQCGSARMSATTPICFGAGHVLSGVSDKRKCRPRGVLVVGENCKAIDGLNNSENDFDGTGFVDSGLTVVPPLPAEASMHWLLSPCDEAVDQNEASGVCTSIHLQSPMSCSAGYGTSSDTSMGKNEDTITGAATLTGTGIGSGSLVSPRSLFIQCLVESPSDNRPSRSSQSPPCATHNDVLVSWVNDKIYSNLTAQTSPCSMDTLGSENIVRTPESNSSIERHMRLPWFDADDGKHAVESVLACSEDGQHQHRTSFSSEGHIFASEQVGSSFEFDCLLKPGSLIELTQLQHIWNKSFWISEAIVENEPWSQLRISWRDGLSSRSEMDDTDCCRCLSDEEDRNVQHFSDPASPEPKLPEIHTERFMKFFDVKNMDCMNRSSSSSLQKEISCAESISMDGGSLAASGDSGWDMCYKNNLFEVKQ